MTQTLELDKDEWYRLLGVLKENENATELKDAVLWEEKAASKIKLLRQEIEIQTEQN